MMVPEKRPQSAMNIDGQACNQEAGCLYALITGKRSVSRRNRATWYLRQLNKVVKCDQLESLDEDDGPIEGLSSANNAEGSTDGNDETIGPSKKQSEPEDLSPSVVSVSPQNGCVFLDSMFDALKRILHLLVKNHEIPTSQDTSKPFVLAPKVFLSVIAYTPFVVAKNNQVLVQNRRISSANIDQVLVEIWICLNRLTQEIHELVSNTCGINLDFDATKNNGNVFVFPQPVSGGVIRHPGSVLEDIYELGLFSSSLMPRLSRLSIIVISDGLLASTNNLNIFRLKSIAVSFVSLGAEAAYPDACFGYTPYIDLMKFISKTTLGTHLSHQDLINSSHSMSRNKQVPLLNNPFYKLFCWTIHTEMSEDNFCFTPRATNCPKFEPISNPIELNIEHVSRFFCVDQPMDIMQSTKFDNNTRLNSTSTSTIATTTNNNNPNNMNVNSSQICYHDWRSLRQLDRNLDADFEQVLSCLLREGYLIKSIQFKHKETSRIIARLILHWRHNLDLEQELSAPYWSNTDPFDMGDNNQLILRPFNTPLYGDTYCEVVVHGSYSFLHNLYCDRRSAKRRGEYRDIAYRQFRQLMDGVMQTHERLQYLSRFYRDSSLSKVPSYLLHGNSLLYEQPHTHRLTSTIENVLDETKISEFQEYWQKISCLDTKSWKNLMHIHTLRLVLEHDQPKHKNIHYQNANGRYTHVQCRRALSAISTFIKSYASFALLEDTTYIKFIYNKDDDLREIETSATKGFIVIRINKLLPIIVIYLMFTSGILDSHRTQIVSYLEDQLTNCKMRNVRTSSGVQIDNILKSKTISSSSESSCILIRSPLERMLKVYSRNFISDFLVHNWAHGLPGSCPYNIQQPIVMNSVDNNPGHIKSTTRTTTECGTQKEKVEGYTAVDNSLNRYNLVFGKYLYGVRVVQTITNLPHDIVPSLAANVLSKISAILVNLRIKQGFHIAFNNSGILNLVVELAMKDHSNEDHASSCLCQYIVFPPTVTNCPQAIQNTVLNTNNNNISTTAGVSSKPGSLSGSLANSDSYMKGAQDSQHPHMRGPDDCGEIRLIKEYWTEQQYGISSSSSAYHRSLEHMRYSEVVDHLFLTDSSIFECLLTYELLQLFCDKLSPYYDLDNSLARNGTKSTPIFSPTTSTSSSNLLEQNHYPSTPRLPSALIEGHTKDGNTKVPLLELEYKFSVVKFLDFCQQASLNVLLFKDRSEFYQPNQDELDRIEQNCKRSFNTTDINTIGGGGFNTDLNSNPGAQLASSVGKNQSMSSHSVSRKMSVDVNELEVDHVKREHRSSYQHDVLNTSAYSSYMVNNPIYSPSLNHMFLETLHKRLKQMHDKELTLSDYDRKKLAQYLKRRTKMADYESDLQSQRSDHENGSVFFSSNPSIIRPNLLVATPEDDCLSDESDCEDFSHRNQNSVAEEMDWRCFLRKGNQENLMIVLVPATLSDITRWLNLVNNASQTTTRHHDIVCPVFVFRCSSSMINDNVLSFLRRNSELNLVKSCLESDLSLHFGQPCNYMNHLMTYNDELNNEILPLNRYGSVMAASDEKTLEAVHFRAFLRKIKNTVLKSRFSSLNDAYLSELFIHKDDILYYMTNVDLDTQKKYHVSSQLKSLAEFIKNYEEYNDSLPKEPGKPCDPLLNSILLQKCGLFINQPIARFNEANPLIKQLHDRKLLFLMRSNYKIELPILEENLSGSALLKNFIKPSVNQGVASNTSGILATSHPQATTTTIVSNTGSSVTTGPLLSSSINEACSSNVVTSSLGKIDGARMVVETKCGSVGATSVGSPSAIFYSDRSKLVQAPRFGSSSALNSNWSAQVNDTLILEAFRGLKCCSIDEVSMSMSTKDISLRHEAHMAEVLRRTGERNESHHYRRVLKSKGNYSQSHSAIDQALKRVDSLGRLEHFCLTPLLFSPSWRSKLAPVRDHTLESSSLDENSDHYEGSTNEDRTSGNQSLSTRDKQQQESDDRWHQMVCNNYLKEYEQYIQTLGFNSVQIRYQSSGKGSTAGIQTQQQQSPSTSSTTTKSSNQPSSNRKSSTSKTSQTTMTPIASLVTHSAATKPSGHSIQLRKGSISTSTASLLASASSSTYNTGYLIKFLNSGCLVFKVGFCKPYVYSILYSIEGERFNNSNVKLNMTAFLDELDNIKVTMHLHSFTYDYHLRSIYSYISGRQLTFSPGYHLISFLDDFRKYYQKAPNYTRNHILCGEISVTDITVTGQQLYNYIITHNSTYNMEVLEMSSSIASLISSLSSRTFVDDHQQKSDVTSLKLDMMNTTGNRQQQQDINSQQPVSRSHANDYVLIELKREKVRYRDGKDPDIFDCGLLITHDVQQSNSAPNKQNCLTLKYFLLLTNQRDLYPKLMHTYDNIDTLGCHRPIRLGLAQTLRSTRTSTARTPLANTSGGSAAVATGGVSSGQSDLDELQSSDLQSSCDTSGPASIVSTSNSTGQTSTSTVDSMIDTTNKHQNCFQLSTDSKVTASAAATLSKQARQASDMRKPEEADTPESIVLAPSLDTEAYRSVINNQQVDEQSGKGRKRNSDSTSSSDKKVATSAVPAATNTTNNYERTICDEEITYLGYFSSDEMDMLKFLQEKTANLRSHIEEVVRQAEVHYRRDYLWHKLMQRTSVLNLKSDEIPLTVDELVQLLNIVESISLATLDPQLSVFTTMHSNWYMKLLKAFGDLKQSSINQHRIYTVKANKLLLLYIDPKCTEAFILLSIDSERGSVEMNMLLKDKQECTKVPEQKSPDKAATTSTAAGTFGSSNGNNDQSLSMASNNLSTSNLELDQDCQQLISDFINFCAAFMWSTFLS